VRLGVLGGTFDPIHLGHLLLAEQAREQLALDSVLVIPAARPPHKPDRVLSPYAVRYRMCELALEGVAGIVASDIERDAARPSYTVDTLRRLRGEPGVKKLWLLVGQDCVPEMAAWHEPLEIFRLASIAVYPRPSAGPEGSAAEPEGERLVLLEGPRLQLSSSEIRTRVHAGRTIRFLVPEPVRRFIVEEGLYRGPQWDPESERRHG
jgi:nicotinate-nucleotide adenylyltransferase